MKNKLLTFSALLKSIRKESGLTQQGLATILGVSKVLIGMIESDMKEPSKKFVILLAKKLEVHPSAIMPFISPGEEQRFEELTKIEQSFIKIGMELQGLLISKKSKLLKNA
jgi:transcriptional regulator with XRE-family HTH domain